MTTLAIRRPFLWLAVPLLAAGVYLAVRSWRSLPHPAWETPVDVSGASFPPRIGPAGTETEQVPAWVVRASPLEQPDWADYLAEIVRSEGVTVASVPCERLDAGLPPTLRALVVPPGCRDLPEERLRRFVEGGGTLVGVGLEPRLMALGKVRVVAQRSGVPVGGVLEPAFQALPEDGRTAVLIWGDGPGGARWPLLLERRIGSGVLRIWCSDIARTVARTRQGDPRAAGKPGLLPHPSPGDLFQADFDPGRYRRPVADLWNHRFGRSLISGTVPVPVFWPFPAPEAAVVVLTGDQDYAPDDFIDYQLARVEDAGGEMTLFLTSVTRADRSAPATAVADQSPQPSVVAGWRAYHHQFSVHPNANGLPRDPAILTAAIEASRRAMQERYGVVPRTIRHHFTFWWGYVGTARVLAHLGFLMDLNYLSIYPGASGQGYLNGAGLPLPFVDRDGTVLPIFQQPTQVEDSLLMSDLGFSAGLDETDAVRAASLLISEATRWGTALTLNFHPLYSVKTPGFLDGLLSAARQAGLPMMSAERWLDLVLRRYQARVTRLSWRHGEASFVVSVPSGALWLRLPDDRFGARCREVRVDDREAETYRVDVPADLAGVLFSVGSGTHQVVAEYAGLEDK